jgi:hypothetical protein
MHLFIPLDNCGMNILCCLCAPLQHTKVMEETSTLVGTMIEGNHPHNKSNMTNLINQLCLEKSQNGLECPK